MFTFNFTSDWNGLMERGTSRFLSFALPLLTGISLTKGTGSGTFTQAQQSNGIGDYVHDFEGRTVGVAANSPSFPSLRAVTNRCTCYGIIPDDTPLAAITSGAALVVGCVYDILARTTLDFTTAGAADNNVATRFVCTTARTLGAGDSAQRIQWAVGEWAGYIGGVTYNNIPEMVHRTVGEGKVTIVSNPALIANSDLSRVIKNGKLYKIEIVGGSWYVTLSGGAGANTSSYGSVYVAQIQGTTLQSIFVPTMTPVSTSLIRYTSSNASLVSASAAVRLVVTNAGDSAYFIAPQIESQTTTVQDYVNNPVAISTKWFDYANPNTVDGNGVVTDSGVRTPVYTSSGYLAELTGTNLFLNSDAPATQNITTTAQTYTLSLFGTGNIVLSGTATGTLTGTGANDRVSLTVTATAGTLTCTYNATCTKVQFEAGSKMTSYIPSAGTAGVRAAAVLSYPTAGNLPLNNGTLYIEESGCDWTDGIASALFNTGATTANRFIVNNSITNNTLVVQVGTLNRSVTVTPLSTNKIAIRVADTGAGTCTVYIYFNGVMVNSTAAITAPTVYLASMFVGCSISSLQQPNANIKNLRIYNTALTDAQCIALTA